MATKKAHRPLRKKPRATFWAGSSAADRPKNPKSESAFNSLIRYLSRRDHSEKELQTKLSARYTDEAVQTAIEKAKAQKWLKDPAELSELFGQALHRQNRGHFAVNLRLKKKGLPALEKNDDLELKKALALIEKKSRGQTTNIDRQQQQKLYRFLANRGFDHETIMLALKK